MSRNRDFPIPIACWSGFRTFKQNLDNPDEIWMVGHSVLDKLHIMHHFSTGKIAALFITVLVNYCTCVFQPSPPSKVKRFNSF